MIAIIFQSYFAIILTIGLLSLFSLVVGLYWIFKSDKKVETLAFAGDDVMLTQLDLARAFIETGNRASAKQILKTVKAQGGQTHRAEAERLLSYI